ncbi:sigma-54 dependent transcriptional regulator [bacterium]|nr:sigma-54 dependent transcriptional regulator [bacterium]MBU1882366.1 sigma-54 dependent transcriptional regulator [bacterium]
MSYKTGKDKLLVVDDQTSTLEVLQRNLTLQGYQVFTAPGVNEAIEVLNSTNIDLVITDMKMPKISGMDLVRHIRENFKDTEVMVITGYASVNGAVEALKTGAEEYLAKPFTDKELFSAVNRSLRKLNLHRSEKSAPAPDRDTPYGLIGTSPNMQDIYRTIRKAANTAATVLITGESGTGKELVARAIHYSSKRSKAPFVPINCGGIPEPLLESELFGYVKGAFTGATESRAGFFQTADGGTIFLDEISETSLAMQIKLLRVLQDKEVCMVGATQQRKVDVRIEAATNKDLLKLVKKQLFREDLYFRLNVLAVAVPPLRDREDDILLLAHYFTEKYSKELDIKPPSFTEKALNALMNYSWPGNVRELENTIQRLTVMTDSTIIDVPDLPSIMRFSANNGRGFNRTLVEVETEHIRGVLASVKGNKTKAAEILGIDRKTLRERLKTIQMDS